MARRFSVSIFTICLLEFVFWFYCTVTAAGAAEEMYMTSSIENFKNVGEDPDADAASGTGTQQQPPRRAFGAEPPRDANLRNVDVDNSTIAHLLPGLGVWVAVAVGLLGLLCLFPHFVKVPEFFHLLRFKLCYKVSEFPQDLSPADIYCYKKLVQVSRSFVAVIAELPDELRRPITIFYLVLRGLDTVEDDMSIALEKKMPELRAFYKNLRVQGWCARGYGTNRDETDLLEQFHYVIEVFLQLRPEYQAVIEDITRSMGDGMAKYAGEKTVVTTDDYNEYCHYVAGLVGIGLSKMFAISGLESDEFRHIDGLSNNMGLFLQKTNVTRDYLEDVTACNPRIFYPKDIWGKYADRIEDLKEPQNKSAAIKCLNEMVTNAMAHITDCIDYMTMLKNPHVFKFCAIPQAMAIATLARIYNNYDVFKKEVKIRKGEAVQIIMYGVDYKTVIGYFTHYINELEQKIPRDDPNADNMRKYVAIARERIAKAR